MPCRSEHHSTSQGLQATLSVNQKPNEDDYTFSFRFINESGSLVGLEVLFNASNGVFRQAYAPVNGFQATQDWCCVHLLDLGGKGWNQPIPFLTSNWLENL